MAHIAIAIAIGIAMTKEFCLPLVEEPTSSELLPLRCTSRTIYLACGVGYLVPHRTCLNHIKRIPTTEGLLSQTGFFGTSKPN